MGVPAALRACHTAEIDGYVVEGHVPADIITRVLPKVAYDVIAFACDGSTRVYATA
jgi:hypothetical protein